jgi:hypothetical protein
MKKNIFLTIFLLLISTLFLIKGAKSEGSNSIDPRDFFSWMHRPEDFENYLSDYICTGFEDAKKEKFAYKDSENYINVALYLLDDEVFTKVESRDLFNNLQSKDNTSVTNNCLIALQESIKIEIKKIGVSEFKENLLKYFE